MEVTIVCTQCNTAKPLEEFGEDKKGKHGKKTICHACKRAESKEYRVKNVATIREYQKRTRDNLRFTVKSRERYIKNTYGLAWEDYEKMYEDQKGSCKICKKHIKLYRSSEDIHQKDVANVDHNHNTGAVRGLLCGDCNRGLGLFKDNVVAVRSAAEYLENYGE